jgi:hypothetical protein
MDIEQECDRLVAQFNDRPRFDAVKAALNCATRDLMHQRFLCGLIKRAHKKAKQQGLTLSLTQGEREVFARALWLEQAHTHINNQLVELILNESNS